MLCCLSLIETAEQKSKFTDIYEKNADRMYNAAYAYLAQKEEAENAVHDAFVKLAENFGRYESLSEKAMEGLCMTIVKNTAANMLYRRKKDVLLQPDEIEALYRENGGVETYFPEEMAIGAEKAKRVRRLLKELPKSYQDILVLRYFYEFSIKETAKFLGISKKAAEIRLYRAKRRAREVMYHEKI